MPVINPETLIYISADRTFNIRNSDIFRSSHRPTVIDPHPPFPLQCSGAKGLAFKLTIGCYDRPHPLSIFYMYASINLFWTVQLLWSSRHQNRETHLLLES
ncbi:hypothetical protein CEXT_480751 [Caerostris extrusa]|uniref:Uncharacterized protein n=1 Tax=Caerostris extrusa TaxID=172846 RepID=A0AAV4WWA8_CAEEX|nr:hypothetical protein CEXT_480751 [Caerostris extrusa]